MPLMDQNDYKSLTTSLHDVILDSDNNDVLAIDFENHIVYTNHSIMLTLLKRSLWHA